MGGDDSYLLSTTAARSGYDHVAWVREQVPESVVVNDVTSSLAAMVCTSSDARKTPSKVTDVEILFEGDRYAATARNRW